MKIIRSAKFNKARTKRYFLFRKWSERPTIVWIMLNPSVADEKYDDKTISKCMKFSNCWGYGGFYVLNLCSDISTCPKKAINKLKTNQEIDPTSLSYIKDVINKSSKANKHLEQKKIIRTIFVKNKIINYIVS